MLLNGIPHEHWIQELSFVATAGFTSTSTPIGIWRFRIGALFPKPRGEVEQRDMVPEIRIELLESTMMDAPRAPDHLCRVFKRLAESACVHVAWSLSMAADEIELYREQHAQWPMSLALPLPDGYGEIAQEVFAVCTTENHFGMAVFRDDLSDQESDLLRIVCRSGTETDQPKEKPKSPNRMAKPKPENPGDVFLLMEFGLTARRPLVAPSSGADAGAKYVRLWNRLAEGVISSECRCAWWGQKCSNTMLGSIAAWM